MFTTVRLVNTSFCCYGANIKVQYSYQLPSIHYRIVNYSQHVVHYIPRTYNS